LFEKFLKYLHFDLEGINKIEGLTKDEKSLLIEWTDYFGLSSRRLIERLIS